MGGRSCASHGAWITWAASALLLWPAAGCKRQREAVPEPLQAPQARLSPDNAGEIWGRWKIVMHGGCGISALDDEQVEQYMGMIASVEPGRMAIKDHVGDDLICNFTDIKISTHNAIDYLAEGTGCGPGNPVFDMLIGKINSQAIKVFKPEPRCSGTPFGEPFMSNPQTLVVQWNGVYFFMKRDAGTAAGM